MSDKTVYIQVILPLKLDWVPFYRVPESLEVRRGDKVRVIFARKEYVGVVFSAGGTLPEELSASKVQPIVRLESGFERVSAEELGLWEDVASYYLCTIGEVFKTAWPAERALREEIRERARQRAAERYSRKLSLQEKKYERLEGFASKKREAYGKKTTESGREKLLPALEKAEKAAADALRVLEELRSMSESEKTSSPLPEDTIVLSKAQESACAAIRKSAKPALLQGVTGSGKTEIYSKLALETLAAGRNVLYLVPEIALSRQLESRLSAIFGERLLIFHSHETQARRGHAAAKTAEGDGYIVLGTRSSLFLPHRNLGLIIVDEEHDRSYKQDSPAPRYSGRDVALFLARRFSSRIVLGSATPSFESLFNCAKGKFTHVVLSEKYYHGEEAEVEIIDTVAERKKRGMVGSFSRKLIEALTRTLGEGGQAIILRNRRAYSPALQCSECGAIVKCPSCNVTLSYHKSSGRLTCHSCGRSWPYDGVCHECGGALTGLGSGTEKIEEELEALFPEASTARLDSDVAARKGAEEEIIREFAEGRTDLLVGTQIITKGFDFPGLRLVAVIDADGMLGVEDFRADERAYDTLQQLRGRASRREAKGRIIIQTRQGTHPVFSRLAGTGAEEQAMMMEERKDFGYPPFTRLIHIEVRSKTEDGARRGAQELCGRLEECGLKPVGPYAPAAGRVDGMYAMALRLSLPRTSRLEKMKEDLRAAVCGFERNNPSVGVAIDVDPL